MYRVLEVTATGADPVRVTEGTAQVSPLPEGTVRWIDLCEQSDDELKLLKERFDFHPLALEDCAHFDQRPKLEEYGSYLFIVVHGFRADDGAVEKMVPLEVHAFLGRDYLVTIHDQPLPELDKVWRRVAGDASLARRGADFMYYLVVDEIVDANFRLLDDISELLDTIEDEVLHRHDHSHLARIFELKRVLVTM